VTLPLARLALGLCCQKHRKEAPAPPWLDVPGTIREIVVIVVHSREVLLLSGRVGGSRRR
jgi:hypothetical protein